MTTLHWDVDTQIDFILPTGKLAVPGAEAIVPQLKALTEAAYQHGLRLIASADNHDLSNPEISATPNWRTTFPPHCMKNTVGQRKIAATQLRQPLIIEPSLLATEQLAATLHTPTDALLLYKESLDVFENPNTAPLLALLAPQRIAIYGVATDFCVRCTVAGLALHCPGATLVIITDALCGIDAAASKALLNQWRRAGHTLMRTAEWLQSGLR